MDGMTLFAFIAAGLAVFPLYQGIVSMAHGGEADQKRSHQHMFKRIAWQAAAVMFVLLALLAAN